MVTIEVGQEYQLKYSQSPEYATELFSDLTQFIFYDSKNIIDAQDYILIKENGLITGLKAGVVGIKPTGRILSDDSRLYIKIKDVEIPVERITLNQTSIELTEGDETTLSAIITPETATNKNIIWSSSNEEVATIENGKVTAKKEGTATITVTTEDGNKTATCKVIVNAKVYPVTSITIDKTSVEVKEGDEFTLIATVKPDNATNKNVTWSSSDDTVASVSNGKVTALKAGMATITAKTDDGGKTATCEVTVNAKVYPVTGVTLDKTSATLTEGDEVTLTATVNPDNATNKNVTWSSSNNTVASVSNGKVTALKAGMATITAKTDDGGKTATCEVSVNAKVYPVTGVTLGKTSVELKEGDVFTLVATIKPDNATNKNVTWYSSDNTVASVSNGKVTAHKAGKTIITVNAEGGDKQATCEIKVLAKGSEGNNESVGENNGNW